METENNRDSECVICASPFNRSTRMKLACLYCGYEACRACNETYILGETIPKCMNTDCGREWTRKYLNASFTKSFLNHTYKKHRENVLFDRERSLMPETQIFIQYINEIQQYEKEYAETNRQLEAIYARRASLTANISRRHRLLEGRGVSGGEVLHYVRKCSDDACRGFLSTQWKCGVCEKWTCNRCHEIKGVERDGEHECDPDKVATAELIMRDTKNCPNCHISIHKIDGCDQMWCTQCHTAFSWRTGRVVENGIHNPHYYEWLRQNGGEGGGIGGGNVGRGQDCIHDEFINLFLRSNCVSEVNRRSMTLLSNEHPIQLVSFYTIVRHTTHIRDVDREKYMDIVNANELNNRNLRIDYMLNRIDEDQYKKSIQQLEKKTEKAREYMNVLEILVNTITDVMARFCEQLFRHSDGFANVTAAGDDVFMILDEIPRIIAYVNECLEDISKNYSSVHHCVDQRLRMDKR